MATARCGFEGVPGGALASDLLVSYGPTLLVDIGFDPTYRPPPHPNIPIAGIKGTHALVDTGATESCIDSLLAVQLNLPIVDRRTVSGVSGPQDVNMHLAQVHIPALNFTIYGMFAGVHLAAGGVPHQALIGRSFLQRFTMTYNGMTGDVTISS